jgi:hypothetical protein
MLKILPIQSKDEQRALCEKCGVTYDADLLAYAASVEDRIAGICQFKLTDKGGYIYTFAPAKDFYSEDALFVLGRGTLNFIDLCGVHYAVFAADFEDEALLRRIGFKKNSNGIFDVDLEGFFTSGHCH